MNLLDELTHFIEENLPSDIRRSDGQVISQRGRSDVAAFLGTRLVNNYAITGKAYEDPKRDDSVGVGGWSCGSGPEEAICYGTENPNWLRNKGANFIRLADQIDEEEVALKVRRDEWARKLRGPIHDYKGSDPALQLAIDHIITEEDK